MTDVLELPEPELFRARRRPDGAVVTEGPPERLLGRQVPHPRQGVRPDGVWTHWVWRQGTLTVTNDRHGYLPLYYVADEDEVCVSPSLTDVVRRTARRTWCPAALGVFVRLGAFVGNETAFRDVRVLPPCGTLTWSPGRFTVTAAPHSLAPQDLNREAALDGFIDLVRAAVNRRLPQEGEPAWLPLSGGQDSRHILFELYRAGVRPRCITGRYRPPNTPEDSEVAAKVAGELGLGIDVVGPAENWLADERRKNLLLGFTSASHYWFLPLAERMTAVGGVAYDGIGGEVLSAGYFIDPTIMAHFEAGRYEAIARGWTSASHERYLSRLLSAEVFAAMPLDDAVARITEELAQHAHLPIPITAYAMRTRQRRGTVVTQYGFLRRMAAVFSPFLDVELYDFLMSLPWRLLADKRFHGEAIARAFPQFAHLPYAKRTETTSIGAAREYRRLAWGQFRYFASAARSRLVNLGYLAPVALRSAINGSRIGTLPVLLLQLERDLGIALG